MVYSLTLHDTSITVRRCVLQPSSSSFERSRVLSRFSSFDAIKYRSSNTRSSLKGLTSPTDAAQGKDSYLGRGGITAEPAFRDRPSASCHSAWSNAVSQKPVGLHRAVINEVMHFQIALPESGASTRCRPAGCDQERTLTDEQGLGGIWRTRSHRTCGNARRSAKLTVAHRHF